MASRPPHDQEMMTAAKVVRGSMEEALRENRAMRASRKGGQSGRVADAKKRPLRKTGRVAA
jgi:hypothetical protein